MAGKRSKNADSERLDDAHMERVIALLEPKDGAKAGTKKEACEILGISYNTSRLGSLIEKYKEQKEKDATRRAEKRGKPASPDEIQFVIQGYLEGEAVSNIAESLYRGPAFVTAILLRYGVPMRNVPHSYFKPQLVPEEAMREAFKVGEVVYSMRYDSMARIVAEFKPGVYRLYLLSEKWKQYCYQEALELASLQHIRDKGIALQ